MNVTSVTLSLKDYEELKQAADRKFKHMVTTYHRNGYKVVKTDREAVKLLLEELETLRKFKKMSIWEYIKWTLSE